MSSVTRLRASSDRTRAGSLWQNIDEALSAEIHSGRWRPGERLPTEQSLAERFQVNRHTIRRAIQALLQRGLLRVEQGRGTFVNEGVIDYQITRRTRFEENILKNNREPSGEVLVTAAVLPPVPVARQLNVHPRTPVVMADLLSSAGGVPVSVSTCYFPGRRLSEAGKILSETKSLPETLKRLGISDYRRAVSKVTARLPTAEEARLLEQPPNRPILQAESLDVDAEGNPLVVTITRFASDRIQIVFEPTDSAA